jgi:cyanate lyase
MSKEFVDTKNIVDLSNLDSWDLVKELNNRGYYTKLIFGISDVDSQLKSVNDCMDMEDDNIIVLTEDEKIDVLDGCFNTDWFVERMNESIEEYIRDNYDNGDYYQKKVDVEE